MLQKIFNKCPDNETIAAYFDGTLSGKLKTSVDSHIAQCFDCRQFFQVQREILVDQKTEGLKYAPDILVAQVKGLVHEKYGFNILDLCVSVSEKALSCIRATGTILVEPLMRPAFVLRSKQIEHNTIKVSKRFDKLNVEVEVVKNKDLTLMIGLVLQDFKKMQELNDLRVTLMKDHLDLESYVAHKGKVIFENVKPGIYEIHLDLKKTPLGVINLSLSKT